MTINSLKIRKMQTGDLAGLMRLKNAERWNQREKDWELLIGYKDSVNLVAELEDKLVASITGINYANKVAWIGMMLVDKEYRGRGISKRLLNETIELLKDCESIKLDATPAGQPVYKKIGFEDEYTVYRLTNPAVAVVSGSDSEYTAERMRTGDLEHICRLDESVFGADRSDLIYWLFDDSPELAWLIRDNQSVIAFCMGRQGLNFTQIGPLYAPNEPAARSLFRSALNELAGKAVVIDLHADKTGMQQWLEQIGFQQQRPFERMYLRYNPHPGKIDNQFGICGPELG